MKIKSQEFKELVKKVTALENRLIASPVHKHSQLEKLHNLCDKKALVRLTRIACVCVCVCVITTVYSNCIVKKIPTCQKFDFLVEKTMNGAVCLFPIHACTCS